MTQLNTGATEETLGTNAMVGGRCKDDHQHQGVVDEFFNSEVNLLNVKEVGGHGVQLEIGIPRPGEHWICLSATECGAVKGQEAGVKEVATYSAEIQGLHNTYFFLVEVIRSSSSRQLQLL